jgi:hypothetical protein
MVMMLEAVTPLPKNFLDLVLIKKMATVHYCTLEHKIIMLHVVFTLSLIAE